MYIFDSHAAFQAPKDTYIYSIIPISGGIGVISSDDSLRLFDPNNLETPHATLKGVNRDVTCVKAFGEGNSEIVCTAGRDGRICLWDPRTNKQLSQAKTVKDAAILSLATSTASFSIAAGTELQSSQATITIWDIRSMGAARLQYVEGHSDDITDLEYHPTFATILLSGSTDGLVNLYNTAIEDEDDAIHQTINHGSSIHHAGFLTESDIFALSDDQKFSTCQMVTNFEETVEEPPPIDFGDLRQRLGCEYAAGILARPGGTGVLGAGCHSKEDFRLIQLKNDQPWTFVEDTVVNLHEAHGSEVVRTFCFLDQSQTVLTGGEDGQIKAWKSA